MQSSEFCCVPGEFKKGPRFLLQTFFGRPFRWGDHWIKFELVSGLIEIRKNGHVYFTYLLSSSHLTGRPETRRGVVSVCRTEILQELEMSETVPVPELYDVEIADSVLDVNIF